MVENYSLRLSHEEVLYLGASLTDAKELYGLQQKDSSPNNSSEKWEEVREGLIVKRILTRQVNNITVDGNVSEIVDSICNPKLFISLRIRNENVYKVHNFYIKSMFAVMLCSDHSSENNYLLTAFRSEQRLFETLKEILSTCNLAYPYSFQDAQLSVNDFEQYIKAVNAKDLDSQYTMLVKHDFSTESIDDLYFALKEKNHILTMITVSFDNAAINGQRFVEEILLYNGKNRLWEIELSSEVANIAITSKDDLLKKFDIISNLFKYL